MGSECSSVAGEERKAARSLRQALYYDGESVTRRRRCEGSQSVFGCVSDRQRNGRMLGGRRSTEMVAKNSAMLDNRLGRIPLTYLSVMRWSLFLLLHFFETAFSVLFPVPNTSSDRRWARDCAFSPLNSFFPLWYRKASVIDPKTDVQR